MYRVLQICHLPGSPSYIVSKLSLHDVHMLRIVVSMKLMVKYIIPSYIIVSKLSLHDVHTLRIVVSMKVMVKYIIPS